MPRIADAVGRVLGGRYRLLAPVGSGASAVVYIAEDVTLHRRVAVKLLQGALADDDGFLRRFRDEARAAAALTHPHVMRVYDWGEDDDGPFLVLELLGGGSLRDVLDAGHLLTPSQALVVGLEAARGLDYAHRHGLVHRDIKPANLLFDDEGRLCIADFGLARALAEAAQTEPSGAMFGTARYAAPEQVRGASLDGRADVYSLALVLVESVTGRVPFASDTALASLMARVDADLTVPDELGALAPILAKAGAANPATRPDAAAFARRLNAAASELPAPTPLPLSPPTVEAMLAPRRSDLTELGEGSPSAIGEAAPVRSRRALSRWWKVAIAVLIALLAAGGAGVALAQALVPSHTVPRVLQMTEQQARERAAQAQLRATVDKREYREDVPDGIVFEQRPAPGASLKENRPIRLAVSRGPPPVTVPDVLGVDLATATRRLEEAGLRVGNVTRPYDDDDPAGAVIDYSPKGGDVRKGSAVDLVISAGAHPKAVPDVSGKTYDEAAAELRSAGFQPTRSDVFDESVPEGKVVSTQPGGGAQAQPGTKVVVRVSKGPELVVVPDVIGMRVQEAIDLIESRGLKAVAYGPGHRRAEVFAMQPSPGTKVKKGSTVALYVR